MIAYFQLQLNIVLLRFLKFILSKTTEVIAQIIHRNERRGVEVE